MKTQIYNVEDLLALVEHFGFLPFFENRIAGFSIEGFCPPELWFSNDADIARGYGAGNAADYKNLRVQKLM